MLDIVPTQVVLDPENKQVAADDSHWRMSYSGLRGLREGFRTSASVDLGPMARSYRVLKTWTGQARSLRGHGLECGHFLPEEAPGATDEAHRTLLE